MSKTNVGNARRETLDAMRAETEAPSPHQAASAATASSLAMSDAAALLREAGEARRRMEAQLQTTARAWNRLPPLSGNRRGWRARLERWIKDRLKRATHWYIWEQVNFNDAAHNALRETLHSLSLYETIITRLQNEAKVAAPFQEAMLSRFAEFDSKLARLEKELSAIVDELRCARHKLNEASAAQSASTPLDEILRERITELRDEGRARIADLTDEQRVSYKQLALQISEANVAAERAGRLAASRLDRLETHIEELRAIIAELEQTRRTGFPR